MASRLWTLLDHETRTCVPEIRIRADDVEGAAEGYEIRKMRLEGGLSDGVDVIRVNNGKLQFDLLPTRGMSLWKAWLGELEIGWKSPVRGPVHPQFVDLGEPSGLGWLDGFDELLVRCGLESNGAPEFDEQGRLKYTLHGRIGNRPAHRVTVEVDGEQGDLSVTGVVEETRFHFLKLRMTTTVRTRAGQPSLQIEDTIENLSATEAEAQVLYHVNFGLPLLDAGSKVVTAAKTVVPRNQRAAAGIASWDSYEAQQPGFEEQVYFLDLHGDPQGQTRTLLKNSHSTQGASLLFNTAELPCYSIWKNTTAAADGYVTGLEPGTNFPNPRSYEGEQGRVLKLEAGGKKTLHLGLEFHGDAASVEAAEAKVTALGRDRPPTIHKEPQAGWCADE